MLGIDETESRAADQQLGMLTARWEKIFIAIQDPVLVVSIRPYFRSIVNLLVQFYALCYYKDNLV